MGAPPCVPPGCFMLTCAAAPRSTAPDGAPSRPEPPSTPGRQNPGPMAITRDAVSRANAAYVEEMYRRYRSDPASIPDDWAVFFAGFEFAGGAAAVGLPPSPSGTPATQVYGLVAGYREFGHLLARLDPLSEPPDSH